MLLLEFQRKLGKFRIAFVESKRFLYFVNTVYEL